MLGEKHRTSARWELALNFHLIDDAYEDCLVLRIQRIEVCRQMIQLMEYVKLLKKVSVARPKVCSVLQLLPFTVAAREIYSA